jgi:flavorubredoxin
MKEFINHLTERGYKSRRVGMIENGSWAPMAVKVMRGMLEGSKDITYAESGVKIISAMTEQNREQLRTLADELCGYIK